MPERDPSAPELIDRETLFSGKLFDLTRDTIRTADGATSKREVVWHPGAVAMLAVDGDGSILFVRQYRHAAGMRALEIPAGTLEPGEEPEATAIRELQEEIGKLPGSIEPMGGFYVAPGYTSEYIHLFLCTDLSDSVLDGDEDEDIDVERLSPGEALAAIADGRIADAKSIVGVLRWMQR